MTFWHIRGHWSKLCVSAGLVLTAVSSPASSADCQRSAQSLYSVTDTRSDRGCKSSRTADTTLFIQKHHTNIKSELQETLKQSQQAWDQRVTNTYHVNLLAVHVWCLKCIFRNITHICVCIFSWSQVTFISALSAVSKQLHGNNRKMAESNYSAQVNSMLIQCCSITEWSSSVIIQTNSVQILFLTDIFRFSSWSDVRLDSFHIIQSSTDVIAEAKHQHVIMRSTGIRNLLYTELGEEKKKQLWGTGPLDPWALDRRVKDPFRQTEALTIWSRFITSAKSVRYSLSMTILPLFFELTLSSMSFTCKEIMSSLRKN